MNWHQSESEGELCVCVPPQKFEHPCHLRLIMVIGIISIDMGTSMPSYNVLSSTIMINMHFTIIIKSKMRRKVRHCCSRSLLICTLVIIIVRSVTDWTAASCSCRKSLTLLKHCSIGIRSGEYGGRKITCAPTLWMRSTTSSKWWMEQLSVSQCYLGLYHWMASGVEAETTAQICKNTSPSTVPSIV